VETYVYADLDPTARKVAVFRLHNLAARFPQQFTPEAYAHAFDLPQDVTVLHLPDILSITTNREQQVVVVAGWPCQDFSAAGNGMPGPRAALIHDIIRIVIGLQHVFANQPVAYMFENVVARENFNHTYVRNTVACELEALLGPPVNFDAAQAGSRACRRRSYWTNLASQPMHQQVCDAVQQLPEGSLYDILRPGRHPMPMCDWDHPSHDWRGVRRIWPTLMSYHRSYNFRPGAAGCVFDEKVGDYDEPCADERELAMGYEASSTAAEGVSEHQRRQLLGQCIDVNALFTIMQAAMTLHDIDLAAVHAKEAPIHGHASKLACVMGDGRSSTTEASLDMSDVWHDAELLHFLQHGHGTRVDRRILKRAKSYVWFNNRLHRAMKDAYTQQVTYRQVPKPENRDRLVLDTHVSLGHLGEKRTIAAMALTYWWYGMTVDIRRVLSGCKLCARVRASGGHQTRDMVTEPASEYGLFHRWGLDYAQDLPASQLGNRHCLIMVDYFSKWIEAIPVTSVTSAETARQFHLHVLARFGLPAEVVTDNGSSFRGAFEELCKKKFIHQRFITEDVPRSNGLAERAVQTIKAALRKHVAARHNALTWDTDGLTSILTGYRCTPQAATGHSPARILFALDPVVDAEQLYSRRGAIDYESHESSTEQIAVDLLNRCQIVEDIGVSVVHNLRTAHERDCRRFKARRSGAYVPRVYHFAPGDFVFVLSQGQKPGGTLGIQARNEVLKVVEVRPSGVLLLTNQAGRKIEKHYEHCVPCMLPNLIGDVYAGLVKPQIDLPCEVCKDHRHWETMLLCDNCDHGWHTYCLDPPLEDVPEGAWLCPECLHAGVTMDSLRAKLAAYKKDEQSRPALELPSRKRVAKARALMDMWHGAGVVHTRQGRQRFGRVVFQGILSKKWFQIYWQDGTSSEHSTQILRNLAVVDDAELPDDVPPRPPATIVMAAKHFATPLPKLDSCANVLQYLSMVNPTSVCSDMQALTMLGCINQLYTAPCKSQSSSLEWDALAQVVDGSHLQVACAPLCRGRKMPLPWFRQGTTLITNHPNMGINCHTHFDPFMREMYEFLDEDGGVDMYLLDVEPCLLELLVPLAKWYARQVTAVRVSLQWLISETARTSSWLRASLVHPGHGLLITVIDKQGGTVPHAWLLLFADVPARACLLSGRVPRHINFCTWNARMPHCLHPGLTLSPSLVSKMHIWQ
jgi:site-specific DNA-cytosine methylase